MSQEQSAKLVDREEALARAKQFLKAQSWAGECDEDSAMVIESNECINVLFRYKAKRQPQQTIISVEKIGGAVSWVRLG